MKSRFRVVNRQTAYHTQPENASIYQTQNEPEMYKENRAACRADYAEFEDYVYERQAEMVKAKGEAG
jgi:hypothetical protein